MKKFFTFLFAALMSVGMYATTVTWNSSTLSSIILYDGDGNSFTKDGVTLTVLDGMIAGMDGNWMGYSNDASFKFSTSLGNFTRIEITGNINALGGSGWTQTSPGAVWTGEANETTFGMSFDNVSQIVFTIGDPAPTTHTLKLVADPTMGSVAVTNLLGSDIVDNGDGTYTVPENVSVTILATPNEGYEFSGWLEGNVLCDFIDCGTVINTMDNPLTFTITQDAACKAEFAEIVAPSAKYYVVGDMTNWAVNADYEMTPNNIRVDTDEEYMFNITLTTGNQFKVVKVEGETQTWYPDGMGNNYGENGEIERDGEYTIYFRPNMDGGEAWFYNCILATRHTEPERVFVGFLFPENGMPANGISMLGSFIDGTVELSYVEETGGYMHDHIMAVDEDKFYLRATDDVDNFLFAYVDGAWDMAEFTFDEVWEEDTWKGDPVKMIDLDLSDNSKYAWQKAIPEGLEEVLSEKAESRKVMLNGMLYIVRDGKMYNVLGVEVK